MNKKYRNKLKGYKVDAATNRRIEAATSILYRLSDEKLELAIEYLAGMISYEE